MSQEFLKVRSRLKEAVTSITNLKILKDIIFDISSKLKLQCQILVSRVKWPFSATAFTAWGAPGNKQFEGVRDP